MAQLTFAQIRALWLEAGGPAAHADVAAAVALAESGGSTTALNDNPATRDYSVGLWQINYFGALRIPRTISYGSPEDLMTYPLKNASAAVDISSQGTDFSAWTRYTSGAYRQFLPGASSTDAVLVSAYASDAVAPSSLRGWSHFQREVNIRLPAALGATNKLLTEAARMLGR